MNGKLNWLDVHNPHTLGEDEHMFRAVDGPYTYSISQIGSHSFTAYVSDTRGGIAGIALGYIDRDCNMHDPGRNVKYNLKCLFATWKEAQKICEQYASVHKCP